MLAWSKSLARVALGRRIDRSRDATSIAAVALLGALVMDLSLGAAIILEAILAPSTVKVLALAGRQRARGSGEQLERS